MSRFLNTRGRSVLTIGICDRCRRKFPLGDLMSDPNAPGLKVCLADRDEIDPYTLPARIYLDDITPRFVRPDVNIAIDPAIGDAVLAADGSPFVLNQGQLA